MKKKNESEAVKTLKLIMLISNGSYEIFQVNSSDALVRQSAYEASTGRFTVPKRTTAVFVEPRC